MSPPEVTVWRPGIGICDAREATVPLMSHALHYGTAVFEGVRAYRGDQGTAVFRLPEHLARFRRSATAYGMQLPCTSNALRAAVHDVIRAGGLVNAYIRPLAFRGVGSMAVDPGEAGVEVAVLAWRLDDYFATGNAEVRATISPWRRILPGTLVPRAKAAGHYLNSFLAKADAAAKGFDEAILLDEHGQVCEASAMNVFAVLDDCLITPPAGPQLLDGVTRATILDLARDQGIRVTERPLDVDELLGAREVFLTGTGARVVPLTAVDEHVYPAVPSGITQRLRRAFDEVTHGRMPRYAQWLDPVDGVVARAAEVGV